MKLAKLLMKNSFLQTNVIKDDLKKIFKEDLIFAFICGSVAENEHHSKSDLDIFILLKRHNKNKYTRYLNWYNKIHSTHRLNPDLEYPGEIVIKHNLNKKIETLNNWEISLETTDVHIYDIVVWMSMLSSQYIFITGCKKEFNFYRNISIKKINEIKKTLGVNEKKFVKYKSHSLEKYSEDIAKKIINNKELFLEILTNIESYKTAIDEINLTLETLNNIEKQKKYIENHYRKLSYISVFMPLNLPLYSIILFIIIPEFFAKKHI